MTTIFKMQSNLAALNLLLDGLDVDLDIGAMDDRKLIQKAVYLAQRKGVDLGYRYGWYKFGPYSPALTRDYYALADAKNTGEVVNGRRLRPSLRNLLKEVKTLFDRPQGVDLSTEDWLELVASVDYLRNVSKYGEQKSDETLQRFKENLYPYRRYAKRKLEQVGLG